MGRRGDDDGSAQSPPLTEEQARMFHDHINMAKSMARRFSEGRDEAGPEFLDDLRSAALLGLYMAARGFDPGRGVKFATYAIDKVYWAMQTRAYEHTSGESTTYRHAKAKGRTRPLGLVDAGLVDRRRDDRDLVDARDEAAAILRRINPARRAVMEDYFLGGRLLREIGAANGKTKGWAQALLAGGIDQARRSAGVMV